MGELPLLLGMKWIQFQTHHLLHKYEMKWAWVGAGVGGRMVAGGGKCVLVVLMWEPACKKKE